jgi:hypothetical protein
VTPLHNVCRAFDPDEDDIDIMRRNQAEIAVLLLAAGASPDARMNFGTTPLHHTVESDRLDIMAILISARDVDGFTALHFAVLEEASLIRSGEGHRAETSIRMLLAAGADVNAPTLPPAQAPATHISDITDTPMELAIRACCVRLWPVFLRGGATLPQAVFRFASPYLNRMRELGGIAAYEKAHRKSFVALLAPKFPRLPVEVLAHIASFWAHVGDY